MKLHFSHAPGYSSVDHFGPEIVSLCRQIAAERPEPDGLAHNTKHILGDYRKMVRHGHAIVQEAFRRFHPCVNYSGPPVGSIRIKVFVSSEGHGYLVPPLVGEDNLSVLGEYADGYKNVKPEDAVEWRKQWVRSHPECQPAGAPRR